MLRKLFCILCTLCLLFGSVGCGSESAESSVPTANTSVPTANTSVPSTAETSATQSTTTATTATITDSTTKLTTTIIPTTTATTQRTSQATTTASRVEEPVEDELRIAIAGNSYVGYSNITYELLKLIGLHNKNATAESYRHDGYTTAAFLYEPEFMDAIRNGEHDILFMCGLFSSYDVQAMTVIEEACLESGTQLVLFPAYNENPDAIAAATEACPSAKLVHWQEVTRHLIREGIPSPYLMLSDAYLHPRPLAGYAGAMMIFTALFGNELTNAQADPFEPDLNRLELSDAETDAVYDEVHRLTMEYALAHPASVLEE